MKLSAALRRPNFAACRRRAHNRAIASAYPNAAGARYFLEKLLDAALAAVTTLGLVSIFFYVFTVF